MAARLSLPDRIRSAASCIRQLVFLAAAAVVDVPHSLQRSGTNDVVRGGKLLRLAIPELVGVRKRHQQDIAGRDLALFAAREFDAALAGGNQMKDADMAQMRHRRVFVEMLRRHDAERRGEAGVEIHRSGQTHRA